MSSPNVAKGHPFQAASANKMTGIPAGKFQPGNQKHKIAMKFLNVSRGGV